MVNDNDNRNPSDMEDQPPQNSSFLKELKRRKVFRVAITYAVVSWLIIQVASTTFGSFGIPVWAFRFVVLMVLLGFPVAVVLAWAFEVTPDGVRKTAVAQSMPKGGDASALNRKGNWYAIGMAAILPTLIFGTLAIVFYFTRAPVESGLPAPRGTQQSDTYQIGTVAVLPFTLFSEDPGLRSTADGLQDEMLTILSEMDPLNVVSRTSTLQFSSDTTGMPEIGEMLGADFIVEGSIQAVGKKISITLQLIHASDDQHIWAQSFDRTPERPDEPLVFQKEMAFELAVRIYQALEKAYPPTGLIKANRDALLEGLESALRTDFDAFWINWHGPGWDAEFDSLVNQIDNIIRIDPDNYVAHDANAAIRYQEPEVGRKDFFDPEWQKECYLMLKRSYAVAPNGFDTNKHLGVYYYYQENKPHQALPYSRRAVELDKELRGGINVYTYWVLLDALCATGQSAAAMRIAEEAASSDLTDFSGAAWFWTRGHQMLGKFEEQLAFLKKQYDMFINSGNKSAIDFYVFRIALAEANWSGSTEPLIQFLKNNADSPRWHIAQMVYNLGKHDQVLELLSEVETGTDYSALMSVDRARARGWAYMKTGNRPLANSYFKGFLNELQSSLKGQWMEKNQPDIHAAFHAYGNACMGNREAALVWADKALQFADPARHFVDYFSTMYWLAVGYTVLGEDQRACELIDLMLSSPCDYKAGEIMTDPHLTDLAGSPWFEQVIRKHAGQLRDAEILNAYFKKD